MPQPALRQPPERCARETRTMASNLQRTTAPQQPELRNPTSLQACMGTTKHDTTKQGKPLTYLGTKIGGRSTRLRSFLAPLASVPVLGRRSVFHQLHSPVYACSSLRWGQSLVLDRRLVFHQPHSPSYSPREGKVKGSVPITSYNFYNFPRVLRKRLRRSFALPCRVRCCSVCYTRLPFCIFSRTVGPR